MPRSSVIKYLSQAHAFRQPRLVIPSLFVFVVCDRRSINIHVFVGGDEDVAK